MSDVKTEIASELKNTKYSEIRSEIKRVTAAADNYRTFHRGFAFPITPEPKKGCFSTLLDKLGF